MKNVKAKLTDYIAMKKRVEELKHTIDHLEEDLYIEDVVDGEWVSNIDEEIEKKLNEANIQLEQLESELADMEYDLEVC